MTDLTYPEFERLKHGECPDCALNLWRLGPRGGAARNVECAGRDCHSRFNVTIHHGQLVFAERIPGGDRAGPYWDPEPRRLL